MSKVKELKLAYVCDWFVAAWERKRDLIDGELECGVEWKEIVNLDVLVLVERMVKLNCYRLVDSLVESDRVTRTYRKDI